MNRLAINWKIGLPTGWGVYGINLAVELVRKKVTPVILESNSELDITALMWRLLQQPLQEYRTLGPSVERGQRLECPVLQPLGDRLEFPSRLERYCGTPDIGVVFFEHVDIPAATLSRAAELPLIIAGSSWNAQVLRDKGLSNVVYCPQGIDLSLFHPAPRRELFPDRFLVFSGGKFEYRKGQDIVVAAFRAFRQRHPDALLVCAWSNLWPQSMAEIASSLHVTGLPQANPGGHLDLVPWLAANGVPPEAVISLGLMRNRLMPQVLCECDLAVFPNRCEGGTNLAAMEAMACGIPTILSANTGHFDLAGDHATMLTRQANCATLTGEAGKDGWGESDVEEIVEAMEAAYQRRDETRRRGAAGARFMASWSWSAQVDRMLAAIGSVVRQDAHRLRLAGRLAEAGQAYQRLLAASPEDYAVRSDYASLLNAQGDEAAAVRLNRQVLACQPAAHITLFNLARLYRRNGDHQAALPLFRRAVLSAPGTATYRWGLAWSLLLAGRWDEAWPHFEYRHEALGLRQPDDKPRWDGSPVAGFRLLVLDEQGQGDTLQFARYLPLIPKGPGGSILFAGKPSTLPLLSGIPNVDQVCDWTTPLPYSAAWVPLMSLPRLLGTRRPADVPPPGRWFEPDAERLAAWRDAVRGGDGRFVVGLCWRGNPKFPDDAVRSPGLEPLRPILEVAGVRFVSLQIGGRREMADLGLEDRIADVGGDIERRGCDFRDTAAAAWHCDLVISSCTSVVHVAGGLGRPTWLLLSSNPDWRWTAQGGQTPWYPGMTLFRQPCRGDWNEPCRRAAARLHDLTKERP